MEKPCLIKFNTAMKSERQFVNSQSTEELPPKASLLQFFVYHSQLFGTAQLCTSSWPTRHCYPAPRWIEQSRKVRTWIFLFHDTSYPKGRLPRM
jgi:hypothetical protein